MSTTQIAQLLDLFEQAFAGPDWHSLLGNLRSVTPADWLWVPPDGRRCIRDLVRHVGGAKYMYHSQAFGDRALTWEHPLSGRRPARHDRRRLAWLHAAGLRGAIAASDDAELDVLPVTIRASGILAGSSWS